MSFWATQSSDIVAAFGFGVGLAIVGPVVRLCTADLAARQARIRSGCGKEAARLEVELPVLPFAAPSRPRKTPRPHRSLDARGERRIAIAGSTYAGKRIGHSERKLVNADPASPRDFVVREIVKTVEQECRAGQTRQCVERRRETVL